MRSPPYNTLSKNNTLNTLDSQIELLTQAKYGTQSSEEPPDDATLSVSAHQEYERNNSEENISTKERSYDSFHKYIKTPDEITHFTEYLISLTEKIPSKEKLILNCFIQISVYYALIFLHEEKWTLTTINLLSQFLEDDPSEISLFDIFTQDAILQKIEGYSDILKEHYKCFRKNRTENTPAIICKHMNKIIENYIPY